MAARGSREKLQVVLDASVVSKWIVPGEPWEEEAALLNRMVAEGRVEAHVPALLLYEVSSVVFRAARMGAVEMNDALEALTLLDYLLNVHPAGWRDMPEIVRLAHATGLTIYDSAYLQLAASTGAVLVTADEELAARGKRVADVIHLADLASRLRGLGVL
ncbi:MAG: type II toxin-antitoxin system VapC family toxin [Thermofilaceae archaeon]